MLFSASWYRDPPIYDIYGGGVTELQVCVNDQTHQLLINKPIAVCTQGSSASLPNRTSIATLSATQNPCTNQSSTPTYLCTRPNLPDYNQTLHTKSNRLHHSRASAPNQIYTKPNPLQQTKPSTSNQIYAPNQTIYTNSKPLHQTKPLRQTKSTNQTN